MTGDTKTPRTCEICFEEKLPVTSSIYKKATKCSKPHNFCQDCMATHILYKIQGKTAMIRCPGIECSATIDPNECCSLITRDSFVEWCDILAESWIAHKGHRRAVCPYEGCSEVAIDECKGGGRQECPRCRRIFCFGCGVKWSRNHHQVCRFEEMVFLNAARQGNWKRCPKCRFFIQRRAGCNWVTCRCGTQFCYKCGFESCRCSVIMFALQIFLLLVFFTCISILVISYYRQQTPETGLKHTGLSGFSSKLWTSLFMKYKIVRE